MADIINLRRARKAKAREDQQSQAQTNRLKHGRSKSEVRQVEAIRQKLDAVVDGARRENAED